MTDGDDPTLAKIARDVATARDSLEQRAGLFRLRVLLDMIAIELATRQRLAPRP